MEKEDDGKRGIDALQCKDMYGMAVQFKAYPARCVKTLSLARNPTLTFNKPIKGPRTPFKSHNPSCKGTTFLFYLLDLHLRPGRRSMSNGNDGGGGRGGRLELQLHLSPPAAGRMEVDGGDGSDSSSSPSSCVSSDGSPGSKAPMVIGACTRCMMYCMVSKKDFPTCINCKQPCLVDLLQGGGVAGDGGKGK
ncbi:hypothetical protein U9M48_005168 [Paspalum notatum var. saurae]|uniref:GIR1-like zinc ribbon domain-containing protein n=1 Tax=Paspalum notatum var. saurae TaxID=547442 RepID=A0AAQ3SLA6_PASNO